MTWRPLLTGEDRQRAEAVIEALAHAFRDVEPASEDGADWFTLARGELAIPIFYAYLVAAGGDPAYVQVASDRLEAALERATAAIASPYLLSGLAGVAWSVEHALAVLPDRAGWDGDPFEDFDDSLDEILARHELPFELYRGIAGVGIYALERLPRAGAARYLERMVAILDASAERSEHGVAWFSAPAQLAPQDRAAFPAGYHSLGVAHGTPGVIAVLAGCCAHGIAVERARPLLEGAQRWLWRHRLGDGAFPAFAGTQQAARPGWCYGDPGIAAVLLATGRAGDARTVLLDLVARGAHAITDAPLCHGAAGLAHVLDRGYQRFGDAAIGDAARTWFRRALAMYRPERGARGFVSHDATPAGEPLERAHVGLVDGSAGIGLALIAATSDRTPDWDRVLAMSLR
jgi:lantibiotic biosynthesis protein